jgi:hypothetical protein
LDKEHRTLYHKIGVSQPGRQPQVSKRKAGWTAAEMTDGGS